MTELNEILIKSKDKSTQKEQDGVSVLAIIPVQWYLTFFCLFSTIINI